MLSKRNIEALKNNNYSYIIGARIKNEIDSIKKEILALKMKDGDTALIQKGESERLIISYSDARAKKDANNRIKGVEKLEKQIKTNKLSKNSINNKGYNKFLKLEGEIQVSIDKEKIALDRQWDGLKGYITNCNLSNEEIISNYRHLWMIEKAFRISKNEILIRPIFHQLERRIEAHICLAFVAYKLYMELDRQLKLKKADISVEKAIEIAKTIYQIKAVKPKSETIVEKILILNPEQQKLANYSIFNLGVPMRKSRDY